MPWHPTTTSDFWSISLSDDLILAGLLAGELFLIWNNGLRQGIRGHSIGKHRMGLKVVDVGDDAPTGPWRGLLRGVAMAVLLDLSVAAIPIGLPTALRRLTPESWHFGGAAYLALLVLLIPLLLPTGRGFADWLVRTKVVRADGDGAVTAPARRRALVVLEIAGRRRCSGRRAAVHRLLLAAARAVPAVCSNTSRSHVS